MLLDSTAAPLLSPLGASRSLQNEVFGTPVASIHPPTAFPGQHMLPRGRLSVTAGGGPKTFPGGVKKWQWKKMLDRKQQNREKKELDRERLAYEAQRRQFLRVLRGPERPWEDWDMQRRRTHDTSFSTQGLDPSSPETSFSWQEQELEASFSDGEHSSRVSWEGGRDFPGSLGDKADSSHSLQFPWDGDEHNGVSPIAEEKVTLSQGDDGDEDSDGETDAASLSQLNQSSNATGWPGPCPNRGVPSSTMLPWLAPEDEGPDFLTIRSTSTQVSGRRATSPAAGSILEPAARRDPRQRKERRMPWEAAEESGDPSLLQERFSKMDSEGNAGTRIKPRRLGGSDSREAAPKALRDLHCPGSEKAQTANAVDRFLSSLIHRSTGKSMSSRSDSCETEAWPEAQLLDGEQATFSVSTWHKQDKGDEGSQLDSRQQLHGKGQLHVGRQLDEKSQLGGRRQLQEVIGLSDGSSLPPRERIPATQKGSDRGRSEVQILGSGSEFSVLAQQLGARKGSMNKGPKRRGGVVVPPVPQHLLNRMEKRKHAVDLWREGDE